MVSLVVSVSKGLWRAHKFERQSTMSPEILIVWGFKEFWESILTSSLSHEASDRTEVLEGKWILEKG